MGYGSLSNMSSANLFLLTDELVKSSATVARVPQLLKSVQAYLSHGAGGHTMENIGNKIMGNAGLLGGENEAAFNHLTPKPGDWNPFGAVGDTLSEKAFQRRPTRPRDLQMLYGKNPIQDAAPYNPPAQPLEEAAIKRLREVSDDVDWSKSIDRNRIRTSQAVDSTHGVGQRSMSDPTGVDMNKLVGRLRARYGMNAMPKQASFSNTGAMLFLGDFVKAAAGGLPGLALEAGEKVLPKLLTAGSEIVPKTEAMLGRAKTVMPSELPPPKVSLTSGYHPTANGGAIPPVDRPIPAGAVKPQVPESELNGFGEPEMEGLNNKTLGATGQVPGFGDRFATWAGKFKNPYARAALGGLQKGMGAIGEGINHLPFIPESFGAQAGALSRTGAEMMSGATKELGGAGHMAGSVGAGALGYLSNPMHYLNPLSVMNQLTGGGLMQAAPGVGNIYNDMSVKGQWVDRPREQAQVARSTAARMAAMAANMPFSQRLGFTMNPQSIIQMLPDEQMRAQALQLMQQSQSQNR